MITLIANSVRFYSILDERIFFYSLENNDLIDSFRGDGKKIIIDCKNITSCSENFLSIYALFKRYGVNRKQLKSLVSILDEDSKAFICNQEMLWYKDIFGNSVTD